MIMLILSTTIANAKTYPVVAPDYQDASLHGLVDTAASSSSSIWSSIVLKTYNNREALDNAWAATGNTGKVDAFTNWQMKGEDVMCVIHIIKPRDWNDVQIQADLGHEVLHCFGADHIGD